MVTDGVFKKRIAEHKVICKIIMEGLADEVQGQAYYEKLYKTLEDNGAPTWYYKPFAWSKADEKRHHERLQKLVPMFCKTKAQESADRLAKEKKK